MKPFKPTVYEQFRTKPNRLQENQKETKPFMKNKNQTVYETASIRMFEHKNLIS